MRAFNITSFGGFGIYCINYPAPDPFAHLLPWKVQKYRHLAIIGNFGSLIRINEQTLWALEQAVGDDYE